MPVWRLSSLLTGLWLLACAWLARPSPQWTEGWGAWWSGDGWGQEGRRNFIKPHLGLGAEVAEVDGDAAIRIMEHTWAELGRLPVRQDRLTLAGWVKVTTKSGSWPEGFLVARMVEGDRIRLLLGFEEGRGAAKIQLRNSRGDWVPSIELFSSNTCPTGRWVHLAFSTDRHLNRLTLDGGPGTERRSDHEPFALARLEVGSWIYDASGRRQDKASGAAVDHDDIVIFDRPLPPEEVHSLAASGRGSWPGILRRPELASRCWRTGWPVALAAFLLLGAVRWLPGSKERIRTTVSAILRRDYVPVRWILVVGVVLAVLLAGALEFQGIKSDAARFGELALRLGEDSEKQWERLDQLLRRSREWVLEHPQAGNAEWRQWLDSQHYPDDFTGVIGVGYAQQVLPGEIAAFEAEWTRRDGFAHRLQPDVTSPRVPLQRLADEPRLPVVLYVAHSLGTQPARWLTNQSILGHDLLFQAPADLRTWSQARRIETALAENVARSSSVETIAPDIWYGRELKGLRLYLPVVTRPLSDPSARVEADAWRGVVFGSVDVAALAYARLKASSQLGFRITTADRKGGRFDVLVDSGDLMPSTAYRPETGPPYATDVPFFDDALLFEVWTTELFDQASPRRWARWVGTGALGLTVLMAALLFVQIRARERQSVLLTELGDTHGRLERSVRERARLSRDLHDGTIQSLYALGLHLQYAQRHLSTAPDRAATGLTEGQNLVQDTIVELREFLLRLQEEHEESQTFAKTVENSLERLRRTTPVEFELMADPVMDGLPSSMVVQLVYVVREAVSNALRHAHPSKITVSLYQMKTGHCLEISDDGSGFDVSTVNGGGMGLHTMRERAAEIGGQISMVSSPGRGTTVRLDFPAPRVTSEPL